MFAVHALWKNTSSYASLFPAFPAEMNTNTMAASM